jgi:UDP-N-acetyl-D-mannosaminuronate dehydrogenase
MGYVACVTAACLADHDYDVNGVDVDGNKVEMINHSQSSIIDHRAWTNGHHQERGKRRKTSRYTTDTAELGSCVPDLRWHAVFELIEEDARWVNIRGLNLADRLTRWTGTTLNGWFSGLL